jgi:hypothetical protein
MKVFTQLALNPSHTALFFRVAAFDHISNKLCGRMESFLFNEKKERLLLENRKEEERRNVERQIREDSQASQMADNEVRMQELMTRNESLQSELHSAEKQLETLKVSISCLYFLDHSIILFYYFQRYQNKCSLTCYAVCVCCMYAFVLVYVCVCVCVCV